jgi:hypothetical protein
MAAPQESARRLALSPNHDGADDGASEHNDNTDEEEAVSMDHVSACGQKDREAGTKEKTLVPDPKRRAWLIHPSNDNDQHYEGKNAEEDAFESTHDSTDDTSPLSGCLGRSLLGTPVFVNDT